MELNGPTIYHAHLHLSLDNLGQDCIGLSEKKSDQIVNRMCRGPRRIKIRPYDICIIHDNLPAGISDNQASSLS